MVQRVPSDEEELAREAAHSAAAPEYTDRHSKRKIPLPQQIANNRSAGKHHALTSRGDYLVGSYAPRQRFTLTSSSLDARGLGRANAASPTSLTKGSTSLGSATTVGCAFEPDDRRLLGVLERVLDCLLERHRLPLGPGASEGLGVRRRPRDGRYLGPGASEGLLTERLSSGAIALLWDTGESQDKRRTHPLDQAYERSDNDGQSARADADVALATHEPRQPPRLGVEGPGQ